MQTVISKSARDFTTTAFVRSSRQYSLPTSPIHYAGPRASRSFRRSRKEVEEQNASSGRSGLVGESPPAGNTVLQPERERVLLPRTATGIHRPVQIQKDVNGVLKETDGAMRLLSNSALVIVR
jgi:hypothetical protein